MLTQATLTTQYDSADHGSVEVTATISAFGIGINSVRRNSDWRSVELSAREQRDVRNLVGWYAEDASLTN
jgi:hypothetical protein